MSDHKAYIRVPFRERIRVSCRFARTIRSTWSGYLKQTQQKGGGDHAQPTSRRIVRTVEHSRAIVTNSFKLR